MRDYLSEFGMEDAFIRTLKIIKLNINKYDNTKTLDFCRSN